MAQEYIRNKSTSELTPNRLTIDQIYTSFRAMNRAGLIHSSMPKSREATEATLAIAQMFGLKINNKLDVQVIQILEQTLKNEKIDKKSEEKCKIMINLIRWQMENTKLGIKAINCIIAISIGVAISITIISFNN